MLAELQRQLHACSLNQEHTLVLGISGGPDSRALLHGLTMLGYRPPLFHFNHKLHAEADEHERFVAGLGAHYELQVHTASWPPAERSPAEAKARTARYTQLFACADQLGAHAVLVAHTADDQAETVLLNLLRGAGLRGLGGMRILSSDHGWHPSIPLVRPLLSIERGAVMAFLHEENLNFVTDPTNRDPGYLRNRVRHELLPLLTSYNPAIRSTLLRTASTAQADDALLADLTQQALDGVVMRSAADWLQLDAIRLREMSSGLRKRVLREALLRMAGDEAEISFAQVERCAERIDAGEATEQAQPIANNISFLIEDGIAYLHREHAVLATDAWPQLCDAPITLSQVDSQLSLNDGWLLLARWLDRAPGDLASPDHLQAWLQLPAGHVLTLRVPAPGDRIQPYGMTGHQKVSDLFIDHKLPTRARGSWPVLWINETVAWVPGLKRSEQFKVSDPGQPVLHLQLQRPAS